jgi:hypothetical protein
MSSLVYQNRASRCNGWTNNINTNYGPEILSLSSFYSPAGSTSLVSIIGNNFFSYSVVQFGTYNPTVYFINSNLLQFYVPQYLTSGTYPVYVLNGSFYSNGVTYTIDNSSGYWLLGSNSTIENTNSNGVRINSSFGRGVPTNVMNTSYTLQQSDNWLIFNNVSNITVTMQVGTINAGREIMVKSINTGNVISASSNITPIYSGPLTNQIVNSNSWATLVCDGTSWIVMQSG